MIIKGLVTASNGMEALINQNDSTANNIANLNTVGFRKQNLIFKNIYDSNVVQKEGDTGEMKTVGALSVGSQVQKLTYDFSQGALSKTENVFDLAIEGDGFFKVILADGSTAYTRNGSFTMNNEGLLTTKDGEYVLDDKNQKIKIRTNDVVMHSMDDIIITEDGQIELNNEHNPITMQKIGIFDFGQKENMSYAGASKFKMLDTKMNPEVVAKKYRIQQGALELSNANVVQEMIRTISTSRNYETLSKLVKTSTDGLSRVMEVGRI